MLEHSIINVLKTFSPEEVKGFKRFLESPYFNTSELALRLYDELAWFYPSFDHSALTKESLYNKLCTGKVYNDSTMRNLLADLVRLAEKFLKQQNFESTRYGTNIHLLDELVKRGLSDLFRKNARATGAHIEENPKIDGAYFLDRYQFEVDKFNMGFIYNSQTAPQSGQEINTLTEAGKHLTGYFTTEIIKILDNLNEISVNRNVNIKSNHLNRFIDGIGLEKIINYLDENTEDNSNIFKIYYYLYMSFIHIDDEKYFYAFKNLLLKKSDVLTNDEKHYLYLKLLDYCQGKSNAGKTDFDKELFEIFQVLLLFEYYKTSTNVYIPIDIFRNIVMLALRMKKYRWLDFFVKANLNKIEPGQQENLYHYTYAHLYFANGEYGKSLEHLMNVDYDYFAFKLDMKSLLLRIYYELSYYESAYSLVDCYNHILRRSKSVNPLRKATHGNFVQYVQKLLKLKLTPDQDEARILRKQIAGNKEVLNKEWLLDKAEELTKKYRRAI
jgi:hypothetical protein